MNAEVEVVVDAPPGWVVLPLDAAADAHAWARAAHGPAAPDEVVAALAETVLVAREELLAEHDVALALLADPDGPLLARADLRTGTHPAFVADAEAAFAPVPPDASSACLDVDRTEVELPSGSSVRVRLLAVSDGEPALLCESVNHLLRPRGASGRVVLQGRWTAVARSAELAAAVDALAAAVVVRPVGTAG